jgi:quercetin dioxygenase-like cupin family protein
MSFFNWDEIPSVEIAPCVKRKIVHLKNVMLVYYEVGAGVGIPIHQHPHEQIGVILQGQCEFTIGDEKQVLGGGEGYVIPSNMKHGGQGIGEETCVLFDVFSPIREDFLT